MDTDLQHLPEDYYLADEGAILEEMAEEDEEIDLYNEETFGLDQDSADEDSRPLTLPEISETTVGLEKTGLEVTRISETMEEEGSSIEEEDPSPEEEETGVSAASSQPDDSQDLDDPAVMRAVHGKPTLESLDSAVVDSGICSTWGEFEAEQDLSPGFMPRTPFRSLSPNISTPTRTMAPKMAHMQFGTLSPNPSLSPLYSPFARTLQRFRVPDHVTQLHPQHRRILSQRRQRTSRHSSWKHWEARTDPYNCLMSPSEKEWVIKVQMIQLQSENPHLDDYYYQAYYEKLERKLSEEELLGERIKREPTKLVTPYIQKVETYESGTVILGVVHMGSTFSSRSVVHIEGSLGQVAVSTCYSPRRAIDAICHTVADEDMKALGYQRLRILNRIEKLFLMLLDVEEIQQEISLVPEEQRTHFHEKQDQKVEYIFACLRPLAGAHDADEVENEFLQSLSVRKGKKLLARLIPYLCGEHAYEMLLAVVQHLPRLMRMDVSEEALPVLYQPLNTVICQLTFTKLIGVLQELVKPVPDSEDLPLAQAFQNQFGVSLLYSLLSQGERLLSSDTPMEPSIGDYEKWTDLVFLVAKELSRLSKTCVVEPLFLPSNLLSLFCRYLDKQTIHGLENKMECQTSSSYPAVPS
ncbi:protein PAT1 homolog 2 isoform X3 [Microcaecilia unicolor]|uniref:Protein PAT1 homolog 2 isoform X3 n=1 Tax=Microcaecilia unicolor TaxID=1415580 RepID=A0A6P7YKA4_9AMPH|nr:protein PAT1 homolog 2 isoform X3 [Microcaecilia unicolor]